MRTIRFSPKIVVAAMLIVLINLCLLYIRRKVNPAVPVQNMYMEIGHGIKKLREVNVERCENVSMINTVPKPPKNANSRNLFLKDCPLCFSKSFDIVIPRDDILKQMSIDALSCLYQRYVTSLQSLCSDQRRYGNINYGGFQICMDQNEALKPGCVINNFNHEISGKFEQQMVTILKCNIHVLEPNGATMLNYKRIEGDMLLLKIQPKDFSFMEVLLDRLQNSKVKQIVLEIHFDPNFDPISNHVKVMSVLRRLYGMQYRIYWFDRNWEFVKNGHSTSFTVNFHLHDENQSLLRMALNDHGLPNIDPLGLKIISQKDKKRYSEIFENYISKHQVLCKQILRLGKIEDGGWDICNDAKYRPKIPCIVYSFGIGYDFSFDDDVANTYGCEVYSFDPSMSATTHRHSKNVMFYDVGIADNNKKMKIGRKNWQLKTLDSIQEELGHTDRRIDILKMDVEGNEKQSLAHMIKSGALKNVAMLCLELHDYYDLGSLKQLYEMGFRIFWTHLNPAIAYYVNNRSFSHGWEIYFVNINLQRN